MSEAGDMLGDALDAMSGMTKDSDWVVLASREVYEALADDAGEELGEEHPRVFTMEGEDWKAEVVPDPSVKPGSFYLIRRCEMHRRRPPAKWAYLVCLN